MTPCAMAEHVEALPVSYRLYDSMRNGRAFSRVCHGDLDPVMSGCHRSIACDRLCLSSIAWQ